MADILCLMRIPPHPDGHGGNQRAWHLLNALAAHGRVHLLMIYPESDAGAARVPLDRAHEVAASVGVYRSRAWRAASEIWPKLPWSLGVWVDLLRVGSTDAPRLAASELAGIAALLPQRRFDTLVACRLPLATIAEALIARGHLAAGRRVVDIDDIMSQFRARQLAAETHGNAAWRAGRTREIAVLEREENRVAAGWDGVGVCSDDDAATLAARVPAARLVTIPNVVERPALPARDDGGFRLLFVGNLGFAPNVQGIERFVAEVLPIVRASLPEIVVEVVGMNPSDDLRATLAGAGVTLAENVPSVVPHYAAADAVIAPVFFGGGTRIKIIEAMAFGRAVVSTGLGAEGLGLVNGVHALIADEAAALAAAIVALAHDPQLRARLADAARAWQATAFGPAALQDGVARLLGSDSA